MTGSGELACVLQINELLYFVQNALDRLNKEDIVKTCEEFYEEEEIEQSKLVLWNLTKYSERYIKRTGKNKSNANLSDIVDCVNCIDWEVVKVKFVSYNNAKVPYFEPDSTDIRVLRKEVRDLQTNCLLMSNVMHEISSMKNDINRMKQLHESSKQHEKEIQDLKVEFAELNSASMKKTTEKRKSVLTYVEAASKSKIKSHAPSKSSDEKSEWHTVAKKVKTIGSNTSGRLKSVAVTKRVHIHVTRLDTNTTADDLIQWVESKSMRVMECNKLATKFDTYNSFHLAIDHSSITSIENVYDSSMWPSGILVRRYFLTKQHHERKN